MYNKAKQYIINVLYAHLIVTLVSLPILILWGIPLSKMSIIGNIIFTPFLMVFLIISSLLFFTELLYMPNGFLVTLLNFTTKCWETLLNLGNKTWLSSFAMQSSFFLVLIPILTFLIISHKKINPLQNKVFWLLCLLVSSLTLFSYNNSQYKQRYFEKLFVKKNNDNTLTIKDYGVFSRKKSLDTFVDFELKPYLIKNFGTMHIKEWIIKKPGISGIKGAQEACNTLIIDQVLLFSRRDNTHF